LSSQEGSKYVLNKPCVVVFCNLPLVCFYTQTFQLQLQSPSGNVVPPNNSGAINQEVKVANPQQVINAAVRQLNVMEI